MLKILGFDCYLAAESEAPGVGRSEIYEFSVEGLQYLMQRVWFAESLDPPRREMADVIIISRKGHGIGSMIDIPAGLGWLGKEGKRT